MRAHYADLQERFALPAELRGGAARVVSVEEHDASVHCPVPWPLNALPVPCPLLRQGAAGVGRAARHSFRCVGQMQKSRL